MNVILGTLGGFSNILIPIFVLFGIGGIISAFRVGSTAKASSNWKLTDGTLAGCRVVTEQTKMRVGVARVKVAESYHVAVRYRYRVDDKEYIGDSIKVGQKSIDSSSRKEAEKIAEKFKASPKLKVYYDPKNPGLAVLKPGGDNTLIMGNLIIGVILIIMSIAMFFYYRPYGF